MMTAEELKNITNVGDKYKCFYGNGQPCGEMYISRFTEKSVWHKDPDYENGEWRKSWSSMAELINCGCYRRE